MNMNKREQLINRLQSSLYALRLFSGMTTVELGERIGVTKQTISNLEKTRTSMSYTQYLALKDVFNSEVISQKQNVLLAKIMEILFDEDYDEHEVNKMINFLNSVAGESVVELLNAFLDKSNKSEVFEELQNWFGVK